MTDADLKTVNAMIRYGGGFVRALGEAASRADDENLERIKQAFPEYWSNYTALGRSE